MKNVFCRASRRFNDDFWRSFLSLSLSLVNRLEWIMLFDDDANVGFFLRYFVEEVRYIYLLLLIAIIMQLSEDLKRI